MWCHIRHSSVTQPHYRLAITVSCSERTNHGAKRTTHSHGRSPMFICFPMHRGTQDVLSLSRKTLQTGPVHLTTGVGLISFLSIYLMSAIPYTFLHCGQTLKLATFVLQPVYTESSLYSVIPIAS